MYLNITVTAMINIGVTKDPSGVFFPVTAVGN